MKFQDDKCFCQSGLKYEECCKPKPLVTNSVFSNKEFSPKLIKAVKNHKLPCIFEENGRICNLRSINSHTLQNNKILSEIHENGHVTTTRVVIKNNIPKMELYNIGVNHTSIFHCFCSKHDDMIFKPIEIANFNKSQEHIFLYSFKSICYSYWKTKSNYEGYKKFLFDKYNIQEAMSRIPRFAEYIIPIIKDKDRLKEEYDEFYKIYTTKNYEMLSSHIIELNFKVGIACCIDTCIMYDLYGNKLTDKIGFYPSIYITCFTENNKSYIILSWLKEHDNYYNIFINQLKSLKKEKQVSIFNIILPLLTEELFYTPKLFDDWNDTMKKYFFSLCLPTALRFYQENGIDVEAFSKDANFNLFKPIQ